MSKPKKSAKLAETKPEEPIVDAAAGAPFGENVPTPEVKEEITEVEFEEAPNKDLPSLDEIKAKERVLRKR